VYFVIGLGSTQRAHGERDGKTEPRQHRRGQGVDRFGNELPRLHFSSPAFPNFWNIFLGNSKTKLSLQGLLKKNTCRIETEDFAFDYNIAFRQPSCFPEFWNPSPVKGKNGCSYTIFCGNVIKLSLCFTTIIHFRLFVACKVSGAAFERKKNNDSSLALSGGCGQKASGTMLSYFGNCPLADPLKKFSCNSGIGSGRFE